MYETTSINTDIIRDNSGNPIESTVGVVVGHVQNPNPPRIDCLIPSDL